MTRDSAMAEPRYIVSKIAVSERAPKAHDYTFKVRRVAEGANWCYDFTGETSHDIAKGIAERDAANGVSRAVFEESSVESIPAVLTKMVRGAIFEIPVSLGFLEGFRDHYLDVRSEE